MCVIGASLKVCDRFQRDYFKLFIPMFIRELLSIHYNIGLCKVGNNWLLGSECASVCLGLSSEGLSVYSFDSFKCVLFVDGVKICPVMLKLK